MAAWIRVSGIGYSIIATPGVYVLAALAMARLRPVVQCSLLASFVVAGLLIVPRAVAQVEKGDWRGIAAYLDGQASSGDMVVYAARPRHYNRGLLFGVSFYMTRQLPILLIDRPPKPKTLKRLKACSAVWLVTSSFGQRPRDLLQSFTIQEHRSFGIRDQVYRMIWRGE